MDLVQDDKENWKKVSSDENSWVNFLDWGK